MEESNDKIEFSQLTVESGAKVVFTPNVNNLTINPTPPSPKTPLDPFATVPPLPPAFIERPEITEPLIEKLLTTSNTVAITAIEGMGGVGKTIVARGLCHNRRIREKFPDGIIWLTIGKEANTPVEERIREIALALNQEFHDYTESAYRSLLTDKAVLIVLDDVWTIEAVEPFLLSAGKSRVLYTSRNKNLAGPLNADEQDVGILDDEQARRFLAEWSGRKSSELPEPHATEILTECKGLALGLAMIGSALKGQPSVTWADIVADLRQAQLKKLGTRPGGYEYETLHACIAVSVEALDLEAKGRYLSLAVLLEDMAAPEPLLQALWGVPEREVRHTMRLFSDRSLASQDARGNIRLHDLQLDFVRGEHSDSTALALEHSALLRSLHILSSGPEQFASQMTGRLLVHQIQQGIASFLAHLEVTAPRPRLRPIRPALDAAGGAALRILGEHRSRVHAVAISANGQRIVSGSDDHTLRVWDLGSNEPTLVREMQGDRCGVWAVALSAVRQRVVFGLEDHTLWVWELGSNQPPRLLDGEGHKESVTAVAISRDGKRAVSCSLDKTLRVWDLVGSEPSRVLRGHRDRVYAVAISDDGTRAVSGSKDKTLRVWDLEGEERARIRKGHTGWVMAVALSGDGSRAISGSQDKTLRVWDLDGDEPTRIRKGHTREVTAVALSRDGTVAISGSDDTTLRIWDLKGYGEPRILEGHTGPVKAVALSADNNRAVSGSDDKTIRVWNLQETQAAVPFEGHAGTVTAVALSRDGKLAVSGSDDATVRVWDSEGDRPPRVLRADDQLSSISTLAVSPDSKLVVCAAHDDTLRVWDLQRDEPPRVLRNGGHSGWISAVALSTDGSFAISGSQDKTLRMWDLNGLQPTRALDGERHTKLVTGVAISADGHRAVSASHDRSLRIWDLDGIQPSKVLEGHSGSVNAVAMSADGEIVVSASDDHTVRIWNLESDNPPRILNDHNNSVRAVALSPEGKRIASASDDHTVRVWDLETGTCLVVFTCDAEVRSCAWGPKHVAAGDRRGRLHLFVWEE